MRRALIAFVLAFAVLPLCAQQRPDPTKPEGENLKTPPTWNVRLDRPQEGVVIGDDKAAADIYFVNMTPGWHVTTGPAAIFYHPASTAEGAYWVETKIHLFDPKGRNEAFGLFFGGQNLDADEVSYDYFLIRNNGQFLIKRRTGSETSTIQDWTPHAGIATYGPDTGDSVPNTLAVEVGDDTVGFFINEQEVARLPRSAINAVGIAGLRINHALNVHIEAFSVTKL